MVSIVAQPLAICLSLAKALGQASALGDIYGIALDSLTDALGVSRSAILLFDPDGVMRFKASRGFPRPTGPRSRGTRRGRPIPRSRSRSWSPTSPAIRRSRRFSRPSRRGHRGDGLHPARQPGPGHRQVHGVLGTPHEPLTTSCSWRASWPRRSPSPSSARVPKRRPAERRAAAFRARRGVDGHVGLGPADADACCGRATSSGCTACRPARSTAHFRSYEREIHPDDRERVLASLSAPSSTACRTRSSIASSRPTAPCGGSRARAASSTRRAAGRG